MAFVGYLVTTIAIPVLRALTLKFFWAWYVAPVFLVRQITAIEAFGLILVMLIVRKPTVERDEKGNSLNKKPWAWEVFDALVSLALFWAVAGVIHLILVVSK